MKRRIFCIFCQAQFRSSRRDILLKRFLEHIKFSRRLERNKKTHEFSRRRPNSFIRRTHQIFQEHQKGYKNTCKFSRRGKIQNTSKFQKSFLKILQEHIRIHVFDSYFFVSFFSLLKYANIDLETTLYYNCLLYTSPSPRDS